MTALTFEAGRLASTWLGVAQASATDKSAAPAYLRTVSIAFYQSGVRLAATDLSLLLHAWVPALGEEGFAAPDLAEPAKAYAVARDVDGRGAGLMKYARARSGGELPIEIQVSIEREADEVPQGRLDLDPGGQELVVLDLPGVERIRMGMYDGVWPDWLPLWEAFKARKTNALALNTDLTGRLSRLGDYAEGPLVWHFGGVDKAARVTIGVPPVVIEGLVMPWRWEPRMGTADEETQEPQEEAPIP